MRSVVVVQILSAFVDRLDKIFQDLRERVALNKLFHHLPSNRYEESTLPGHFELHLALVFQTTAVALSDHTLTLTALEADRTVAFVLPGREKELPTAMFGVPWNTTSSLSTFLASDTS